MKTRQGIRSLEPHVSGQQLWSTSILHIEFPDVGELNARLARIVKSKEAEVRRGVPVVIAGLTEGVTTHWQEYNVLNFPHLECRELREMVLLGLQRYFETFLDSSDPTLEILGVSCWMNILRYGQSLRLHHHDPAFLVGHYIVQTGYDAEPDDESEEGHTVYVRPGFLDRSQEGPWDSDWRRSERPREGRLTVFPGYVRHEVRPYLGSSERITIAFDCYVKKQNPVIYFGGPRWYAPGKDP